MTETMKYESKKNEKWMTNKTEKTHVLKTELYTLFLLEEMRQSPYWLKENDTKKVKDN
jgi:hypothetical protein